jgi:hypothetical protein
VGERDVHIAHKSLLGLWTQVAMNVGLDLEKVLDHGFETVSGFQSA